MSTPTNLALLALLFFTSVLLAQEAPPPPNRGPGPGLPIDGFIWLGALAAIAYGAVKKNNNFKK